MYLYLHYELKTVLYTKEQSMINYNQNKGNVAQHSNLKISIFVTIS